MAMLAARAATLFPYIGIGGLCTGQSYPMQQTPARPVLQHPGGKNDWESSALSAWMRRGSSRAWGHVARAHFGRATCTSCGRLRGGRDGVEMEIVESIGRDEAKGGNDIQRTVARLWGAVESLKDTEAAALTEKLEMVAGWEGLAPERYNNASRGGESVLHLAARRGLYRTIEVLCRRGFAVDVRSSCGRTALHEAAGRGMMPAALSLLAAGADLCARDCRGRSVLDEAERAGQEAVLRVLLELALANPRACAHARAQGRDLAREFQAAYPGAVRVAATPEPVVRKREVPSAVSPEMFPRDLALYFEHSSEALRDPLQGVSSSSGCRDEQNHLYLRNESASGEMQHSRGEEEPEEWEISTASSDLDSVPETRMSAETGSSSFSSDLPPQQPAHTGRDSDGATMVPREEGQGEAGGRGGRAGDSASWEGRGGVQVQVEGGEESSAENGREAKWENAEGDCLTGNPQLDYMLEHLDTAHRAAGSSGAQESDMSSNDILWKLRMKDRAHDFDNITLNFSSTSEADD